MEGVGEAAMVAVAVEVERAEVMVGAMAEVTAGVTAVGSAAVMGAVMMEAGLAALDLSRDGDGYENPWLRHRQMTKQAA